MNIFANNENIALGMKYTVSEEAYINNAFPANALNDPGYLLTDGVRSPNTTYSNKEWLKMFRGNYKYIDFDFEKDMLISGYSIRFLLHDGPGILPARELKFMISKNGIDYYTVDHILDYDIMTKKGNEVIEISFKGTDFYNAKYVRLMFTSDVHSYVDELEIYGCEVGSAAEKSFTPDPAREYPDAFATANDRLDGLHNLILMYNSEFYKNEVSPIGKNTYSELLPYAAYINKSQQIVDTMYDTFLFLPLNPGDDISEYNYDKQAGIQSYIDNTIGADEDINMTALNRLAGDIKKELDLPDDYKIKVFMSVPFQRPTGAVFGKLNGNTDIKLDSLENRLKIVKWTIDQSINQFNEANFENLKLTGFYWYEEIVNYTLSNYEENLVKEFNNYVHSKDLGSIWIPYYQAPGSLLWKELGFDAATLQSGYAFASKDYEKKPESVHDSMSIAKKYGLGVEFEIDGAADNHERYEVYIKTALELGAEKGISMFYQQGGPGVFYNAAYSSDTNKRKIYDLTYKYIKDITPSLDPVDDLIVIMNTTRNNAIIPINYPVSLKTSLSIKDFTKPASGSLSLDKNGFVSYIPEEGFTGNLSFSFKISDGYYTSELYNINIIVTDNATSIKDLKGLRLNENSITLFENKTTTETEGDGIFEVVVDSKKIVISASYTNNSIIPENGYVLSASGEEAAKLEAKVKKGDTAKLDRLFKNILFIDTPVTEEENDPKSKILIYSLIAASVVAVSATAAFIIKSKKKKKRS